MRTYPGYKNKMIIMTQLIFTLFLISSCTTKNKTQISCTVTNPAGYSSDVVYLIDHKVVHEISDPSNRAGQAEQTENEFLLHFPKTAQSFENEVRINRNNGVIEYEYGSPPFFVSSEHNVYFKGKCEIKKVK